MELLANRLQLQLQHIISLNFLFYRIYYSKQSNTASEQNL